MLNIRRNVVNLVILVISLIFLVTAFNQRDTCSGEGIVCEFERIIPTKIDQVLNLTLPVSAKHLWDSESKSKKQLALFSIGFTLLMISSLGLLLNIKIYFFTLSLLSLLLPYNMAYIFCWVLILFVSMLLLLGIFVKFKSSNRVATFSLKSVKLKDGLIYVLGSYVAAFGSHWADFGGALFTNSTLLLFAITLGTIFLLSALTFSPICVYLKSDLNFYNLYFFVSKTKAFPINDVKTIQSKNQNFLIANNQLFQKIE